MSAQVRSDSLADVAARIDSADSVAITAHVNPDGDASGSSLALALMLRRRGKKVRLAIPMNDLGAPGVLETFAQFRDDTPVAEPDLLVCLDCATVPRIALPELRGKAGVWPTINIDHHETNTRYGHLNYVVGGASSTGELIYDLATTAKWDIDRDVAEALWTAVVTDTGRFSYSSTTPSTLRCAADLLSKGVRVAWLNDELFSVFSQGEIEIRRRALDSLETWFNGRVSVIALGEDDYRETGCTKSSTETFANIPRSVRGAEIAVFLYRLPGDPKTHASIRAREPFSALPLASEFGGGGHDLAAGATLDLPLDEAKKAIRSFLAASFDHAN